MAAITIDGRGVAASMHADIAAEIEDFRARGHRAPALHVVLCGDDPASATYVRNKERIAHKVGIAFTLHRPAAAATTDELVALVEGLNRDDGVDAILVQLPLPDGVDSAAVMLAVSPEKDADGFHPLNFGRLAEGHPGPTLPCTPAGCMELLRRYEIPVAGANAVVVGRSAIVGRPMALMLTNADATVTVCHSKTRDLPGVCRAADILVVAMGRPGMVTADFVKPGACVIDVGTTPQDGKVHGDVDFESVAQVAGYLTPVPGGVGPMTIALLMRNTLGLARAHAAALTTTRG